MVLGIKYVVLCFSWHWGWFCNISGIGPGLVSTSPLSKRRRKEKYLVDLTINRSLGK
jgi:hypothetical protein